jgi:hypothetical protein
VVEQQGLRRSLRTDICIIIMSIFMGGMGMSIGGIGGMFIAAAREGEGARGMQCSEGSRTCAAPEQGAARQE